ncbi:MULTISPECIES: protein translocase subunit SecF [unclassified Streptomyces]|uniref:protein translocase subunit SecF n=1 Tax=unclassified Streptomyces TaxID=2593676 RepID=UPI000CD4E715|nr:MULTISPECIES: protein translocase subunit SecF [unclassified Streptomyces]
MPSLSTLGARLYRGETAYDFVGKRKFWYAISVLLVIVSLTGLGVRGVFLGVEFQGGAVYNTPAGTSMTTEEAREVVRAETGQEARVQTVGTEGSLRIQVTDLETEQSDATRAALAEALGVTPEEVDAELVGPSWGEQMTEKAFQGMLIFMVLVCVYLAVTFEWRMSLAAMIALLFDLVITVGVYALAGFEVTPGTVVGLLTVLSYSIYDTVVVFDKVQEKTADLERQSRFTYSELSNQAVNATIVRSMNTSITGALPVAALLFIGTGLMGGGMLRDIALPLLVGLLAGTYSSLFIAVPVVVDFKLRDAGVRSHERRVLAKRAERGTATPSPAAGQPSAGPAHEGDDEDDESAEASAHATATGQVTVQRRQPVSNSRTRGRPSGKRR